MYKNFIFSHNDDFLSKDFFVESSHIFTCSNGMIASRKIMMLVEDMMMERHHPGIFCLQQNQNFIRSSRKLRHSIELIELS